VSTDPESTPAGFCICLGPGSWTRATICEKPDPVWNDIFGLCDISDLVRECAWHVKRHCWPLRNLRPRLIRKKESGPRGYFGNVCGKPTAAPRVKLSLAPIHRRNEAGQAATTAFQVFGLTPPGFQPTSIWGARPSLRPGLLKLWFTTPLGVAKCKCRVAKEVGLTNQITIFANWQDKMKGGLQWIYFSTAFLEAIWCFMLSVVHQDVCLSYQMITTIKHNRLCVVTWWLF